MIKRTLYFGNPAYLKTANGQMVIELPATDKNGGELVTRQATIEDIGVLILDHQQITITQALLANLLANNTAVITCDAHHHPTGLLLNLDGHTLQSQKFQAQVEATLPLKKQLWQQTISAKIHNQAAMLTYVGADNKLLHNYSKEVKSGDSENHEALAAAHYWKNLFPPAMNFTRERNGVPPNSLLNYGYAILRAVVARNLVGSGLLPTLGIFHRNQYNAYCLADDIMEPYRPFVDKLVVGMVSAGLAQATLTTGMKQQLLGIPAMDVYMGGQKSPLMNAVQKTTASLAKCFQGTVRKIAYPTLFQ